LKIFTRKREEKTEELLSKRPMSNNPCKKKRKRGKIKPRGKEENGEYKCRLFQPVSGS
jgi:hypothetical protein